MNYRYLEDIATADLAFEAWGEALEEMFTSASEATINAMIGRPWAVEMKIDLKIQMSSDRLDILLFDFLNELLFYKDSQRLILKVKNLSIEEKNSLYNLKATLSGEKLDPERHHPLVDVKAATMHKLNVERDSGLWKATVVLDI